jgi:outer membrane protein assembly factor BamB
MRWTCLAAAAATVAVLASPAPAADWPGFRGPNRDGLCTETGLLKEWPDGGPKQVWSASNLGLGFGTPSVANGKIYGIGRRDEKDGVWALKESDGSELWFAPFADPTKPQMPQNNGPCSTPTVHDGKVLAVSVNGTLACLDAAKGSVLWKKSYVDDFGGKVPAWAYTDSVYVDGDKVICVPCGSKAAVAALKLADGEVIWTAKLPTGSDGCGYSSPVKATIHGTPMYVVLMGAQSGLVGLHTDTGKVFWQYKGKPAAGGVAQIPTPIVKDDLVWVSTSYSGGSALLQILSKSKDEFEVKEVKAYKKADLNNHHGGMVLVGDYIYFGHDQTEGRPVCVEFKTGEIKWGPVKSPAGGQKSAAVLYADGRLYFRYENRVLVLIDPDPKGLKVVSSFQLPPADQQSKPHSWPHPVIANGKLYIRDQTKMYCYDVKGPAN